MSSNGEASEAASVAPATSNGTLRTRKPRRGQNNFDGLAKRIAEDPTLRAQLRDVPANIFLHDHNAPTVRSRRAMVRREFLGLMRAYLTGEGTLPATCSDADVERYVYQKERVIDFSCMYLTAVGSDESTNRGRIGERFKIGQLRQRAEGLWWYIIWFLLEDAGAVYPAWKLKTEATMYKVAVDASLNTEKYAKEYFGTPELWLLLDAILTSFEPSDWLKQHYAIWATITMTGARPGSLALNASYRGEPHYLKWKDIRFLRMEGKRGLFLEVKLRWLKGQRDLHNARASAYKGATFVVYPCESKANLCADLTWILPLLAIDRGLFGTRTLDELECSDLFELVQDPAISDQAVFIAGREGKTGISERSISPLSSSALNPVLQKIARRAGLGVRSTAYSFRREFITAVSRNVSVDQAKELATHAPDTHSSYGRYDYGMGDINVTEVRFAESKYATSGAARNELRMLLSSPAIAKLNIPFDEESCKRHVVATAKSDDTVVAFDEALRVILTSLCEKFGFVKPSISTIIETIDSGELEANLSLSLTPEHVEDANTWVEILERVENSKDATVFLKNFLRARKNNKAFVYALIRREYVGEWEASFKKPTLKEITERRELSHNPKVLQDAAAAVELQSRSNVPVHVEAFKTAKTSAKKIAGAEKPVESAEIGAADWDGMDVGEASSLLGEDFQEVELDLFDQLSDGDRVLSSEPDAEHSEDKLPHNHDTEYVEARRRLVERWTDFGDVERGATKCPLCLAQPWDPTAVDLKSAFKVDRHVCAPSGVHNPAASQKDSLVTLYAKSRKTESGKFSCRWCLNEDRTEKSWSTASLLSRHLQKHHKAFCKRLLME